LNIKIRVYGTVPLTWSSGNFRKKDRNRAAMSSRHLPPYFFVEKENRGDDASRAGGILRMKMIMGMKSLLD
jgi:hypothetical protein